MECPLSRVPFASIVVEEEDGDDVGVAETPQVEAGRTGDVLTCEVDAVQQQPQQHRVHFAALRASKAGVVHAVQDAAPAWHERAASPVSNSSRTGSSGQVTHGLRLALSGATAVAAASSSTHSSYSESKGTVSFSRTLHLRSTAGPPQATTKTPAQPSPQRVPPDTSSSRRRTLKDGAEAEETVTRTASSSKTTAAAKNRSAARESRRSGGHTDESASRRIHARPVRQSAASAAVTAPRSAASVPPSPPLVSASPEERAAETHRLAVQAARPSSLSVCFDWWMYLCYYDTHALFTSQTTAFEVPLRPVAAASASVFYAELTRCFAAWRRQHWDSLVVLRDVEPVDAGARRRGTATATRVVRDLALLEYASAVWYESLRVQRLMVQLLLSGSDGSWSFDVGCFDALLTALGAPPSVESPLCPAPPGPATVMPPYHVARPGPPSGMAGTAANSPTTLVTVTRKDAAAGPLPTDGLSIRVPTATRMLSLLHVLDVLWNTLPTSIPFRMPVSEMEAPGYYRSTRDPVSLCQLYEEAFCGMTAPTHRACVRQRALITRRLLEVQAYPPSRIGSGNAVGEEVQSCFFSPTHLRERLTTLKANCVDYNGGGSELSRQASALLSAGVKALRDSQAEEDSLTAYQVREEAHVREAPPAASDERAAPKPGTAGARFLEDLPSLFPPSEAAAVVPPNLRQPPPIGEHTADVNSASGHGESSRHRRVLHLRSANPNDVASSISPSTPNRDLKDFWVQCDDCNAWHKLATRLDPVPDTWTCGFLGLSCSSRKKKHKAGKRTLKKATTEGKKRTKASAQRHRGARDGPKIDGTDAAPNAVTAAPHNLGGQGDDSGGGSGEDDDVPLVDTFPVAVGAAMVAATAKPLKRRRSTPRKSRTIRQEPKKARVLLPTPSSSKSNSSDSEPDSDSGLSDGGKGKAASAQPISRAPRQAKSFTVATHKLPRSADVASAIGKCSPTAAAAKATGTGASHTASTTLQQLMQAVAELEGRPLQDSPFDQLEEIKRLEKRLSAMD
ncbi:hypothetical protein CGC21_4590 [Leishmania donovani]|uniref:CW-type domain-containing protein n=1 Tax=Leishmania donovani TaxID=5661 RepID=A0A504XG19_LEIDO|nr:hypothetical protein CGC21_4590 [Leishmania donovani]